MTVTTQLLLAAIEPPASLMPTEPTAMAPPALLVRVPPQVLLVVVLATVMAPGDVGNRSVNAGLPKVMATGLELVKVMVSSDGELAMMPVGLNVFSTTGFCNTTVLSVALLLVVLSSPPPDTVAWFTCGVLALAATLTVRVMATLVAFTMAVVRLHVTT